MKPRVRQAKILEEVRQRGHASVEHLSTLFKTSRETIRRDLHSLAEAGKVKKTHGAAKLPDAVAEGPFKQRMAENTAAKRAIANLAAPLIAAGDTLFIDTGSTTLMYAELIAATDDLTVITNSTAIAKVMGSNERSAGVYLIGGAYDCDNHETSGPMALAQIASFRARHAVITVGGIHPRAGVTDFNSAEAEVARAMIERAEDIIVLADASKFDRAGAFAVCPLEQIDYLVTNAKPDTVLNEALVESTVSVLC